MAVFEKKREDRIVIDDTKPLAAAIIDTQLVDGHTEYVLQVYRIPERDKCWTVQHRYSEFANLHSELKRPFLAMPNLPPKRLFGNTDQEFVNERKADLQKYVDELLNNPLLSSSEPLRKFFDPQNCSRNLLEEAKQNVLIVLRSGGSHTVTDPIPEMGTRLRKNYFFAHPHSNPKSQHVLWWAPYGPDRSLHLHDVHSALTTIVQCHHPYILSPVSSVATDSGICVIRRWHEQGSLRDLIYRVKPQFNYLLKYSHNVRKPIPIDLCAVYGRQILMALLFLHEKGLGHGCLHSGNIVVENNMCRLIDLENQVVGLPHPLRFRMVNLRLINSLEAIDVYSFGHLLYEMVFQEPLYADTCEEFPPECPPLYRSVLESILTPEACRNGLPSLSALLTHTFFNEVPLHSHEKPSLRIPASLKTSLASGHQFMLERLIADQKKVRHQKKMQKIESVISQPSSALRLSRSTRVEKSGQNGYATPEYRSETSSPSNHSLGNNTPVSDVFPVQ